jgi:SRSO17 transposase
MSRLAPRFSRVESWRRACDLVAGLMSDLPRKNCWTIAEHAGHVSPDGLQHLLARASWDQDGVRDDLRDYVLAGLGDGGIIVVDETGDLKKGTRTVGVQRQYTGTAGRIENAQVAVYLTYATDAGHAFIDRELYLPRCWTDDRQRMTVAGVPDDVGFTSKPQLAKRMIARAIDSGVAAAWVTGDEVYGASTDLRAELEKRQLRYVLAVACDHQVATGAGKLRADQIAKQLPAKAWQRLSAGAGAKGPRWYAWAMVDIDTADQPPHRWLLIRRNHSTGELAYYRCHAPHPVPLGELVTVAGRRWTVEESFQAGKGLCGLDEHQVRTWISWQRWTILAMTAHAFLTVLAAHERSTRPAPDEMIPLTCNEIKHLINALGTRPPRGPSHCLHWSAWRRRRQHHSRLCHYRRRGAEPP